MKDVPLTSELAALLAPLQALAALLPEAQDTQTEVATRVAQLLGQREADAIRKFALAGQSCLSKLQGATVKELSRISAGSRALARAEEAEPEIDPGHSIYELFAQYDSDNDGMLSSDEFRSAFTAFTEGKFCDAELNQLVAAADVNRDGNIDIHEFTVWLYGSPGNSQEATADRPGSSKKGSEEALRRRLGDLEAELRVKKRALKEIEDTHEEEMDATHDFWRAVAKHAVLTIDTKVHLETAEWLGNGKYGFVLKSKRRSDNREVVVKMMGVRWSHLAVKEWHHGLIAGKHPNIVEYEDVMLHADNDKSLQKLLASGYEEGKLKSRTKRSLFPDRYICLTQELMNRGTVQDWLDDQLLVAGGMIVVMQQVGCALAYLHKTGVTHNDIKPENVMLHETSTGNIPEMHVKLGDLGLATKSTDRVADYWQYGMTLFCMVTGEKFGTRKYKPEIVEEIVNECSTACEQARGTGSGRLANALTDMPTLLRGIFPMEVSMEQVEKWPSIQGWSFYDDGGAEEATSAEFRRPVSAKIKSIARATTRRHMEVMGDQ